MQKPSLFQLITFVIAVLSLVLNAALILWLYQGRAALATSLAQAGGQATALADEQINYAFTVDQTIPIKTQIPFNEKVPVAIDFYVDETFPVNVNVPFADTFTIPLKATLPVDTDVQIPFPLPLNPNNVLSIPIKTDIPIDLKFDVPLSTTVPIKTVIPVKMPIKTEVMVNINRTVAIDTQVPVQMNVPVVIKLSETPFGAYLKELGQSLRQSAVSLGAVSEP